MVARSRYTYKYSAFYKIKPANKRFGLFKTTLN